MIKIILIILIVKFFGKIGYAGKDLATFSKFEIK